MKKISLFFFFSMFLHLGVLCSQQKEYELTLCCITRDDNEYLPEWIDFHHKQGIQHFYLYDNLTKDSLNVALKEYIQEGLVEVIDWPYEHQDDLSFVWVQYNAYTDYVKRHGNKTEWCAFIDTDEFLFCPDGTNLRTFIKDYKAYQEVLVCWILYGTSNIWQAPKGKIAQTLLYRAPDNFHLHTKPIVKPEYVSEISLAHFFHMRDPSKVVDENFNLVLAADQGFCPKSQNVNKIRINHYVFRDGRFFEEVKLPRYLKRGISREAVYGLERPTNMVYDDCILKCIP